MAIAIFVIRPGSRVVDTAINATTATQDHIAMDLYGLGHTNKRFMIDPFLLCKTTFLTLLVYTILVYLSTYRGDEYFLVAVIVGSDTIDPCDDANEKRGQNEQDTKTPMKPDGKIA